MNYRHIYHAGSFVDVFKHLVLILLLESLVQKDKPYCYIETHAGTGLYDLQLSAAQKTQEYSTGITQLWSLNSALPDEVKTYLEIIKSFNAKDSLRYYPGSPKIAAHFLRAQDRMVLSELHPEDAVRLKNAFQHDKQVTVCHQDGYQALKALLPPKERRGLVLIDPAFEENNEIEKIDTTLQNALKKWETGIYAIWYPLKNKAMVKNLQKKLINLNSKEILITEFSIYPEDVPVFLNGCGMAILNPPWQLDEKLKSLVPWLWHILSPQKLGQYRVEKN